MSIPVVIALICIIVQTVVIISQSYRMSYLHQKCVNRMSPDEIYTMDKTYRDFWSFLD